MAIRFLALWLTAMSFSLLAVEVPPGFEHIRCEDGKTGVDHSLFEARLAPFHDFNYVDAHLTTERGLHPLKHKLTQLSFTPDAKSEGQSLLRLNASSGANVMSSAEDQLQSQLSMREMPDPKTEEPAWIETCKTEEGKYEAKACKDRSHLFEVIDGKLHANPELVFVTNFPQLVTYSSMHADIIKKDDKQASALFTAQWSRYVEEVDPAGAPVRDTYGRTVYRLVDNGFQVIDMACRLGD